ncbi:prepilin-type N-terminal cleavage/methylation domain-containing protein [Echinimonas agarilytica]|uniref:prepilin-type N-terminal cleavage/methylation domain-containing protein n=1 Tax=Echinimonas agarilytica TaxID=1215918 RepID=UPI002557FD9D|nr:prepilin-type N-terminal cleavage/methylation domain-containing protein [Echinimonas agarilytica]
MLYVRTKSQGFTLIEIVVVVVILGVLAVTAAPRFLSFKTDARISALEGIAASLDTATSLIQSKAVIMGKENQLMGTTLAFDNISLTIYNQGVPREVWNGGFIQLIEGQFNYLGRAAATMPTLCTNAQMCIIDNLIVENVITGKGGYGIFFFPEGKSLSEKDCFAYYAFELSNVGNGELVYKETGTVTTGC